MDTFFASSFGAMERYVEEIKAHMGVHITFKYTLEAVSKSSSAYTTDRSYKSDLTVFY